MAKSIYIEHPVTGPENTKSSTKQNKQATPVHLEEIENEVRTSLDMPVKLHKAMRRLLLEEELTMKQYVIHLIIKDLGSRGVVTK
ncbi:hypothetical protein [Pseudocnuella soli]|uniref:hypothetical protein n=1 Tax=Pseudocnuella soli TaxID=2502779 RepID=UPI00104DBC97|nr:hypothetical protein [Pseudocnuella soli]